MSPRTETELMDSIAKLAAVTHWLLHHDRPARTEHGWRTAVQGNAGFLDVVLARDGVVVFRELKGPYDKPTDGQVAWLLGIDPTWREDRGWIPPDEAAVRADIWRPKDWDTRIVPFLSRARHLDYRSPLPDGGQHELPGLRRDRATPGRRA